LIEEQTEELQCLSLQNKKMKDELKYHNELNETEPSTRNLFMIEKAARQKLEEQLLNLNKALNKLQLEEETLLKMNKEQRDKYNQLLQNYKKLNVDYDTLKIEHEKILQQCKFLEEIVKIEGSTQ